MSFTRTTSPEVDEAGVYALDRSSFHVRDEDGSAIVAALWLHACAGADPDTPPTPAVTAGLLEFRDAAGAGGPVTLDGLIAAGTPVRMHPHARWDGARLAVSADTPGWGPADFDLLAGELDEALGRVPRVPARHAGWFRPDTSVETCPGLLVRAG